MISIIKSELFKTGGLEKYTWQLARDFCALGVPLTLLTTGTISPPFSHPLLHIVSFPIDNPFSVLNLIHFDKACADYLKSHPTARIFSLDRIGNATHIRAGNGVHAHYLRMRAQEEGKLKALSFSLNPLHRTLLTLEKKGFENPNLQILFTNSHMVRSEILSHYAVDPKKITVVHNGVEWTKHEADFDAWQEKRKAHLHEHTLDPHAYQLLFIGHNFRRKGLEKLLRALSILKSQDVQLSVVGKEKEQDRYRDLCRHLGVENKVFFFGPRADILPFYQASDALVIPSLYDPFANVTVESLSLGLFVVSSKGNGGHEVLSSTQGAIIEDLDDPHSFASALKTAIAHPKTQESASAIRLSVKHLDFSNQLRLITLATLEELR